MFKPSKRNKRLSQVSHKLQDVILRAPCSFHGEAGEQLDLSTAPCQQLLSYNVAGGDHSVISKQPGERTRHGGSL